MSENQPRLLPAVPEPLCDLSTEEDVRRQLRDACNKAGGVKAWATEHGVSATFVHYVLKGHRGCTGAVAKGLGLEVVVAYRKPSEAA